MPLRIKKPNEDYESWSLRGKRIVLAPACSLSTGLLTDLEIRESEILGFLDRDPVLHGKSIEGVTVYGYSAVPDLDPEVILVASPEQHRADILQTLAKNTNSHACIAVLTKE
jgi:FlaA1/EpsC-like NDP-sugar epimerase